VDAGSIARFSRQIALPEIGLEGQQRLALARVAVVGGDLTAEVSARYLAAAGVGTLVLIGSQNGDDGGVDAALRASNPDVVLEHRDWPGADGQAWMAALAGTAAIVRAGFGDDPMLRAAARLGIPAVVARAEEARVDVLSFANAQPAPDAELEVQTSPRARTPDSAGAVVAGTLAASEAVRALVDAGGRTGARHLRVPLDGGAIVAQDIPWGPR
jgi:hypothetical protein